MSSMVARDRAAQAPFLAMHDLLDDAAALVTCYGSLSDAADRLGGLERENADLRAALGANSAHFVGMKARVHLSPVEVVAILQRTCTCVGDVSLLERMLEEALQSGRNDPRAKSSVHVVLSVHQVELGEGATANLWESDAPVDFVADEEAPPLPVQDAKQPASAKEKPRRPRKRLRCGKRSAVARPPRTETEATQWTDRIQHQLRALRSVVGNNGEVMVDDAVGSNEDDPRDFEPHEGLERDAEGDEERVGARRKASDDEEEEEKPSVRTQTPTKRQRGVPRWTKRKRGASLKRSPTPPPRRASPARRGRSPSRAKDGLGDEEEEEGVGERSFPTTVSPNRLGCDEWHNDDASQQ